MVGKLQASRSGLAWIRSAWRSTAAIKKQTQGTNLLANRNMRAYRRHKPPSSQFKNVRWPSHCVTRYCYYGYVVHLQISKNASIKGANLLGIYESRRVTTEYHISKVWELQSALEGDTLCSSFCNISSCRSVHQVPMQMLQVSLVRRSQQLPWSGLGPWSLELDVKVEYAVPAGRSSDSVEVSLHG